ncbi:hypothetical protein BASA81_011276 [Batrachochytrium salamandrivorans]|nr:hypothetical protein BASA81_011276 [Batrachochytrium salamandrivorans]
METRRRGRALSFGFGGRLVSSLGSQVTVHSLVDYSSQLDLDGIQSFAPLLSSSSSQPKSQQLESAALELSTRSFPSSVEDGPLPGSASLLYDCIGALLLSSSPTSRLSFEKRVILLLSDADEEDHYNEEGEDERTMHKIPTAKDKHTLEQLMVSGEQEQAVLFAMKHHMWPEALVLSHFVSAATFRRVSCEYATSKLTGLNRLSLLLFSGKGVEAVMQLSSKFVSHQWKQVVLLVLRNRSPGDETVLAALGDRLWKDCRAASAAHVCYLVAKRTDKVLLFGGDHLFHVRNAFSTPGAVMRTEAVLFVQFETRVVEELQPFRLMFAMWLADLGFIHEATVWVKSIRQLSPNNNGGGGGGGFQDQLDGFEARLMGGKPASFFSPPPPPRLESNPQTLPDYYKDPSQVVFTSKMEDAFKPIVVMVEEEKTPVKTDPFASSSSDPFASASKMGGGSTNPFTNNHKPRLFTPKRNLFATDSTVPSTAAVVMVPTPALLPPVPLPPPSTTSPPTPVPSSSSTSSSTSSSWMTGFRGWLTQKLIPMPKNSVAAKTGEVLSARYDEQAKRWIFPGDAPPIVSGPPPFPSQ